MDSIFISYRRTGSSGYGGRLQDDLGSYFGGERVFRDIDSIRPGTDFVEVIQQAVARSGVVLALISRGWSGAEGADGRRRLDDPDDFVRLELEAAFDQAITVIPVLVEGARVPTPEELPPTLARLSRIQGIELSDERWDYDVRRLIGYVEEIVGPGTVVGLDVGEQEAAAGLAPSGATGDRGREGESGDSPSGEARRPTAVLPPSPAAPTDTPPAVTPGRPRWGPLARSRWGGVAVVAVLFVIAAVAFLAARSGKDRPAVPDVVEQDVATAVARLEHAGFVVTTRPLPDSTRPRGVVVAQDPPAGSAADDGSGVLLVVAEPDRVAVPEVVNLKEANATAALVGAGLLPNRVEEASGSVPAGAVISVTPAAGTSVDKGTTVTLTVSTGRPSSGVRSTRPTTTATTATTRTTTTTPPTSSPNTTAAATTGG